MYQLLPWSLRVLLGQLLLTQPAPLSTDFNAKPLTFALRHQHGVTQGSRIIFADNDNNSFSPETFTINMKPVHVHRPASMLAHSAARTRSMRFGQTDSTLWDEVVVEGPDVSDRETLLTMAKMTNNAYYERNDTGWYDLGEKWNTTSPFGWEPDADGFRGHIFVSDDNSTVVLSLKGTSGGSFVGGSGSTIKKDKLNDNVLFSCCCARVGPTWSTVCGCYAGSGKCDQSCVEKSLVDESLFYPIGTNLYNNVSYMYPNANIILTGHSLGGSLASLIAITFGAPAVTFEAPPDRLPASRLHLPFPPSTNHVTQVFNNADPLAQGGCTGVASVCASFGYAMESRCHTGKLIVYDTVGEKGWHVITTNHRIKTVIDLLSEDWKEGMPVPDLTEESEDCVDCYNWEYGDYNKTA